MSDSYRIERRMSAPHIEGEDVSRRTVQESSRGYMAPRLARLDEALEAGSSAAATLLLFNGTGFVDGPTTIQLYEVSELYRLDSKTRVWASWSGSRKRWECIGTNPDEDQEATEEADTPEPYKPIITYCLTEDLEKTDTSAAGTISSQRGYGFNNPAASVTLWNSRGKFSGDSGDCGTAVHKGDPDNPNDYEITDTTSGAGQGFAKIEGYIIGKMLKSDSGQAVSVLEQYGTSEFDTNEHVGVQNPQSSINSTGIFQAEQNAWCKASREIGGDWIFDVVECPAEDVTTDDSGAAIYGAFGGAGVADGGMLDLLVMNVRERQNTPWEARLDARQAHRRARGRARGDQRDGAARRAAARRDQGLRDAFSYNVGLGYNIHAGIHDSYDSYWNDMSQIFGGAISVGAMPPHLPW